MRITNPMVTNRMLLNINRNARNVDRLYNQLSTGKRVIFPSDDPILAARALKFRTNVRETEQYQRNVTQGLSWMEVTEGAFKNVVNITSRIRDLLVQGASDENSFEDRLKIVTDIEQLVSQLGSEMNVTYGGRFVFSGYRTDHPPVIQNDDPKAHYEITQDFSALNLEQTAVVQADKTAGGYTAFELSEDVQMLKLAYSDGIVSPPAVYLPADPPTDPPSKVPVPVVEWNSLDDDGTGDPPDLSALDPNTVYFVKDTGSLVLGSDIASKMQAGQELSVTYDKKGIEKGELNPIVYFNCTDKSAVDPAEHKSYNMDKQDIEYEFGVSTRININSLAKNVYTDKMYADLVDFCKTLSAVPANTLESIMSAAPSLSEEDAKEALQDEQDLLRQMSQSRFNSLLGLLDGHVGNVTRQHTDLGSRMSRLELIENRLEEDRINYKKLLSDNEDVDYTEAAMELNTAESVYQAALQVGAKIIQMTLADYIR